jgi:hypothetical protein
MGGLVEIGPGDETRLLKIVTGRIATGGAVEGRTSGTLLSRETGTPLSQMSSGSGFVAEEGFSPMAPNLSTPAQSLKTADAECLREYSEIFN